MNALLAVLAPEDVAWASAARAASGRSLPELLEERLGCGPREVVEQLAACLHFEAFDHARLAAAQPAFDKVGYLEARRRGAVALREADLLWLVLADPADTELQDWATAAIDSPFAWGLAHRNDLAALLAREEDALRAIDGALGERGAPGALAPIAEEISLERIGATESAVVRLVDSTLFDAYRAAASDVHLETGPNGLAVKYRIDGVLCTIERIEGAAFAEQALSRVKVMAELDISERRVPQDGRFRAHIKGREVDFRVSIMPSIHGEDAVIRILDRRSLTTEQSALGFGHLGFGTAMLERLREAADQPHGMLLVTGPTGSGKTTTLYAALSEASRTPDKIVTIEDPVEYQLSGVLQIPVNEAKGLNFARGLRSILRHDPDRIMVGEIRDPETAEIAIQAALTGHLVYTTVHANSVYDVIGRFVHMGTDLYGFASAVNAILAQRLVRVLCPDCVAPGPPDDALLRRSRLAPETVRGWNLRRAAGCAACRGTGYRGRRAVGELLLLDDALRELIVARAPVRELKAAAQAAGTRSLREAALDLVREGLTTLEEVNRVSFVA